jgi:inosine-uridine nucleoside N-ribohydrolase
MLANPEIHERLLVSKNVCHGVMWDRDFHDRIKALPKRTPGMDLVLQGMELYLAAHDGKKLHDPLAMAVAIDPEVCTFKRNGAPG